MSELRDSMDKLIKATTKNLEQISKDKSEAQARSLREAVARKSRECDELFAECQRSKDELGKTLNEKLRMAHEAGRLELLASQRLADLGRQAEERQSLLARAFLLALELHRRSESADTH